MRAFALLAAALGALLAVTVLPAQTPDGKPPCSEPQARQFDFWVGSWTVEAGGKVAGHNHISRIQNGCTLLEEYTAAGGGYEGKSFNYYDPGDDRWHQVWVDSGGLRLHLAGGYEDGRMSMSGKRTKDGKDVIDRITWFDNEDGTVRQLWEVSNDGGETWKAVFDGIYRRDEG